MADSDAQGWIKIKAQVMLGEEIAMGPGKAALLEAIGREGSISAAGRALGMSYRRTWMLVDTMNRCWSGKLVDTVAGGSRERGARLTGEGVRILAAYRALETAIAEAAAGPAKVAMGTLRPAPGKAR